MRPNVWAGAGLSAVTTGLWQPWQLRHASAAWGAVPCAWRLESLESVSSCCWRLPLPLLGGATRCVQANAKATTVPMALTCIPFPAIALSLESDKLRKFEANSHLYGESAHKLHPWHSQCSRGRATRFFPNTHSWLCLKMAGTRPWHGAARTAACQQSWQTQRWSGWPSCRRTSQQPGWVSAALRPQ